MRIIHLLQSSIYSGAEAIACQIIQLFCGKSQHNFKNLVFSESGKKSITISESIEMIYVSPDGPIREALSEMNIPFYPLKKFNQREIDLAVRDLKPDLIHSHDFNASVHAAKYRNIRVISHLHHNPRWLSRINVRSVLYLMCSCRYEKVLCASQAILKEYIFQRKIENKALCLPNVVNAEKVLRMAKEEKMEPIDLLFVGRLAEPKDPLRFLRIVKNLKKKYSEKLSVVMVGDGSLQEACRQFINQNRLEKTVRMTGFEANPYKYMEAARVVLMPSEHEGFGLVAVEAMVLGRVVLGTPVGGLVEILKGGGEICADDEQFVSRTLFYLTNGDARREMASRAKAEATKYVDFTNFREVIEYLYLGGDSGKINS